LSASSPWLYTELELHLELSQGELADKLGLKEQQIQRYEMTEYASASMNRVLEIAGVLRLKVPKDISVSRATVP